MSRRGMARRKRLKEQGNDKEAAVPPVQEPTGQAPLADDSVGSGSDGEDQAEAEGTEETEEAQG